ncbi:hypothetical protein C8Q73DRAFT_669448 [Cubamyces lactineus]|nr:hypothetical protein C8Q73DRAFT_669448 [Cubamyces lactineus]
MCTSRSGIGYDNQGPVIHKRARVSDQDLEGVHWRGPPEVHGEWPVCYWQEATSKWRPYEGGKEERGVLDPDARVILLRRPDVLLLHGLGEILEFVENDSAGRAILAADNDATTSSARVLAGVSGLRAEGDCGVKLERAVTQGKYSKLVRKQAAAGEFVQGSSNGAGVPWQMRMRDMGYSVTKEQQVRSASDMVLSSQIPARDQNRWSGMDGVLEPFKVARDERMVDDTHHLHVPVVLQVSADDWQADWYAR